MSDAMPAAATVEYKVVLAVPASGMTLAIPDGSMFRLPRVFIPKWTRPAEEITRALRDGWNLNTVVVVQIPSKTSRPACAVAEVMEAQSREGDYALRFCDIDEIEEIDLAAHERERIRRILSGTDKPSGPFSRLGWLKDALEWIQSSVRDPLVEAGTEFRQYNAGDTFALVRFATRSGPAYWLKATGEPNKHELAVTATLSELFPQYLPPLIAQREDWNAWVTEEAGSPLAASQNLTVLTRAVEALAELQMQSLNHRLRLKEAGCFDQRLLIVQAHLADVIAYLEEAMGCQTSNTVLPLQPARLREIGAIVEQACLEMQDLSIPPSLVHGDINLDNILYDGSHARFIDWAEAGLGNPFLTLQQLIQHVIRDGEHLGWASALRHAYKRKWRAFLDESQIDRAFALAPLLTMISYLYGRGDWLTSPRRHDPSFQGFARTVARYMDRAASEPMLLKELPR